MSEENAEATTVTPQAAVTPQAVVTLRPVTPENIYEVLRLRVNKNQEQFVADNARSLAEAAYAPFAWPRAIYAGETPVGFVMLYDNPHTSEYFLWRLLIDQRYQRMGFGRRAVEQVIDYVAGRPNATSLGVSYVPAEGSPQPFYLGLGFVETGEMDEDERIMRLDLSERAAMTPPAVRPLTHVVLFKFKQPTDEVLQKAAGLLRGLSGQVPQLISIEVGLDVLHSGRSYDLVLITRFASLADMEAYQAHPEHVKVLDYLRTVVNTSVAVDFERE